MVLTKVIRTGKEKLGCVMILVVIVMVFEVAALNGPNVCMVKQNYNITKRIKYRAPVSVRTYVWCFSMPPRCSKWSTEMRDLTRLETEERTAEVAICCPGYKMQDVSCIPICPNGRTGMGCSDACPPNKWGPNCVNTCSFCEHGSCSPITGECRCSDGWQGESCEISMPPITISTLKIEVLTTTPAARISAIPTTTPAFATTSITTVITDKEENTAKLRDVIPTSTSILLPKFFNTVSFEKTTENILDIGNQTAIIPAQTSVTASTKTANTIATSVSIVSTYNHTEIASPSEVVSATSIKPVISSTIKLIKTLATDSPMAIKNTESNNEPKFNHNFTMNHLQSSKNIKLSDSTATDVTEKKNNITISTTILPNVIPTIGLITEIPSSTVYPVTKEYVPSVPFTIKEIIKIETTHDPEATVKFPTTLKFKPKEIWIKPASKGEVIETKKTHHDVTKNKLETNKDFTINTTPRTIIVSIIPTSVSYATFKKIALTTASYAVQRNITIDRSHKKTTVAFTKLMAIDTTTTKLGLQTTTASNTTLVTSNYTTTARITKPVVTSLSLKPESVENKPSFINTRMTEMSTTESSKSNSTNFSTKSVPSTDFKIITKRMTFFNSLPSTTPSIKTEHTHKYFITAKHRNLTKPTHKPKDVKLTHTRKDNKNLTNVNRTTTENPTDEEVFHILTEPEHITAVVGEKEKGRTSMDLVSVVSIAGGIMMAIITVAVIIVMIERCKRPRYEDVRKINDIHMQVMIDNNDAPPPYVRSIFHTPLPDPPISEKCHYQPISTLDRNLKQFMRPVVIQTISPIMLENFRGILECHYDHLPRRSHDFSTIDTCCALAPSMNSDHELRCIQHNINESTIEILKCEAKMDVIDATTSEPLYAEIPCWRPYTEHATEVIAMNGEAVTEL